MALAAGRIGNGAHTIVWIVLPMARVVDMMERDSGEMLRSREQALADLIKKRDGMGFCAQRTHLERMICDLETEITVRQQEPIGRR